MKVYLLIPVMVLLCLCLRAQDNQFEGPVSIKPNGSAADNSALLDINSNDHGVLIPRMTTAQKNAIGSPALGLLVFDTDEGSFYYFDGIAWRSITTELNSGFWEVDDPNVYYNNGNVGIGTDVPSRLLDVLSSFNSARIRSLGISPGDKTALEITATNGVSASPNDDIIGLDVTASADIGTNVALRAQANGEGDHAAIFDGPVVMGHENSSLNMVEIRPAAASSGDSSALFFAEDDQSTFGMYWLYDGDGNDLELFGRSTGTIGKLLAIDRDDGYMSIAQGAVVIDPDLNGDSRIYTDELEIRGGSDLAELFDIRANTVKVEPGMVVSIDPDKPGALTIAQQAYDRKVVGVIAGANGIEAGMIMGQEGSIAYGDYPVSLSGRVYVLADESNGVIEPGDFLTTSDIPGRAMKVKRKHKADGAILGKAMSEVDENGYVLVLITLQ